MLKHTQPLLPVDLLNIRNPLESTLATSRRSAWILMPSVKHSSFQLPAVVTWRIASHPPTSAAASSSTLFGRRPSHDAPPRTPRSNYWKLTISRMRMMMTSRLPAAAGTCYFLCRETERGGLLCTPASLTQTAVPTTTASLSDCLNACQTTNHTGSKYMLA